MILDYNNKEQKFQLRDGGQPEEWYVEIGKGEEEHLLKFVEYALTFLPCEFPATRLRYELKRFK